MKIHCHWFFAVKNKKDLIVFQNHSVKAEIVDSLVCVCVRLVLICWGFLQIPQFPVSQVILNSCLIYYFSFFYILVLSLIFSLYHNFSHHGNHIVKKIIYCFQHTSRFITTCNILYTPGDCCVVVGHCLGYPLFPQIMIGWMQRQSFLVGFPTHDL